MTGPLDAHGAGMTDQFTDPGDVPRFTELEAEYEVLRELGRGGTAVVYLARERELGRHVAIKVIRSQYVEDAEAAARLVREARTVGALQHPNIVALYGTRRLRDGSLALFMQYVPGRTLREVLDAEGALPFPRARRILMDMAQALAYAHRHRIVHRDLKPENVYIDDDVGIARLADFGIARPWDIDSGLTLPGTAIGTPTYMSPEQVDGTALDGRSDLYSLGIIGYEMLTGARPWAGETVFNIMYRQKHEALPPLESLRPGVPEPLRRAVEGAIAKEREQRWPHAQRFIAVLAGDVTASPPAESRAPSVVSGGAEPPTPAAASPHADAPAAAVADNFVYASAPATPPRRRRLLVAGFLAAAILVTAVSAGTQPWLRGPVGTTDVDPAGAVPAPAEDTGVPAAAATAPAALAYGLAGVEQEGTAGDTLPEPLMLRVEDATGGPVAGATVRFAVAEGSGVLVPEQVTTDESGFAAVRFVPDSVGSHTIHAMVGDMPVVRFTAAARARPAGQPRSAATARSGEPGPPVAAPAATARPTAPSTTTATAAPSRPARRGLAAGGTHTCALDGASLLCWGGNDSGQLGDGTTTRRLSPTLVALPESPAAVAAGVSHSCSIGVSGAAWCWGSNASGQLGDGTTTPRPSPTRVAGGRAFTAVAAGTAHTCALTAVGALYCWGRNSHGQLGDGSRTNRPQPVRVAGGRPVRSVVVGWSHTCALDTGGTAWCWGRNDAGQLGDGSTVDRPVPTPVAGTARFSALTAGSSHTCGVASDGAVLCWGRNGEGQLGIGDGGAAAVTPTPVSSGERFTTVAAGAVHTCGLARDGAAWCWGGNPYGQVGDGSTESRFVPTEVAGGRRFTALTASGAHICAGQAGGDWFCWGYNVEGQLGDGSTGSRSRPAAVGRR